MIADAGKISVFIDSVSLTEPHESNESELSADGSLADRNPFVAVRRLRVPRSGCGSSRSIEVGLARPAAGACLEACP